MVSRTVDRPFDDVLELPHIVAFVRKDKTAALDDGFVHQRALCDHAADDKQTLARHTDAVLQHLARAVIFKARAVDEARARRETLALPERIFGEFGARPDIGDKDLRGTHPQLLGKAGVPLQVAVLAVYGDKELGL